MSTQVIRGIAARTLFRNLATAFREKFKAKDTVMVAGQERTAEWLANAFDAAEQQFVRVDQAKARYHQSRRERDAGLPIQLARAAVVSLEVTWNDPTKLGEAGIPAPKTRRELTALQKFVAAEKARKTRALRGTMGPKQRAKIKAGDIQVSTSAPSAAAPAPAPATAAAPAKDVGTNTVVPTASGANPVVS